MKILIFVDLLPDTKLISVSGDAQLQYLRLVLVAVSMQKSYVSTLLVSAGETGLFMLLISSAAFF